MGKNFMHQDPWRRFRRYTQARIALGRAGSAIPTREHLALQLAGARARDAVNAELDFTDLAERIEASGIRCRWCGAPITADIVLCYPHEGGVEVDGFDEKQWVYFRCTGCGCDWSLQKLCNQLAQAEGRV